MNMYVKERPKFGPLSYHRACHAAAESARVAAVACLALALAFGWIGAGVAQDTPTPSQTPTQTETPTQTFTPTNTPTVVPTNTQAAATPTFAAPVVTPGQPVCEATRFCAWKYKTVAALFGTCSSNRSTATVTINGLAKGDFIHFYVPNDASGIRPDNWRINANNTAVVYAACTGGPTWVTLEYLHWDRTYTNPLKNIGDP